MEKEIIECIPNFSEGRDMNIIKQVTDTIIIIKGIRLLNVEPGKDTNRTVVTFIGPPEEVIEAAFSAVKRASELIDMSKHHGEHPRIGATDVCPLVPVSGISMGKTVEYARKLAKRIGEELGIPVYCYENAAFEENRRNLANCRKGEYEGLNKKLADPRWKPDFGPACFNSRTGATVVGARDFLVAFNVNLNTVSTRMAAAIASDIREKGGPMREGGKFTGKIVKDSFGSNVMVPGSLKSVKAIGWYIREYGITQVSMNLTNISVTPVHIAFDEVCRRADERGVKVTGSELIGLIPLKAMLDAGKYFLKKQKKSVMVPDDELIRTAIICMGLDEIHNFDPKEKIIEYAIAEKFK
jgi:glutamate formiminotransferase/formiminotetrahydrofolate cyclodeaminase